MSDNQTTTTTTTTTSKNVIKCQTISEFSDLTEQLFKTDPNNTRYTFKYNHTKGRFELKTTNNVKLYKFKSDQLLDVSKLEKVNQIVLKSCTSSTATTTTPAAAATTTASKSQPQPQQQASKKKNKK